MARFTFAVLCAVVLSLAASVTGFAISPAAIARSHTGDFKLASSPLAVRRTSALRMAEGEGEEPVRAKEGNETPDLAKQAGEDVKRSPVEFGSRSFFAPNENLKYGSSRDEDGKSNVWSVEPKVRVSPKGRSSNVNLPIAGIILAACAGIVAVTVLNLPGPNDI